MTDNLFDNFIKGKMQNASTPVREAVWEKIIAQDKKRRGAFWWRNSSFFWIGLVILMIAGVGYLLLNTDEHSKPSLANNSLNRTPNSSLEREKKVDIKEVDNVKSISTIDNKEQVINKPKNEKRISNSNENIEGKKLNKVSKTQTNDAIGTNNNLFDKAILLRFKHNNSPKNRNPIITDLSKSINNQSVINSFNDDYSTKDDFRVSSVKFNAGKTASLDKNLMIANTTTNLFPIINMRKLLGLNNDGCGNYIPKDFYLETYASADYSTKRVSNISTTDNYLRRKDSAEKQQMGFTTGVRFSRNLTDNWYLKAGIQYSQINETFSNRRENERRQTIVIITRTLIRPGLADTTVSDTTSLLQIGYKTEITRNRYSSLEIPVLLSYETGNSESNWRFAITGGLIINATTWYSGNTYDDNFNVISLKPASNGASFYRHQLGFSVYASASIIKKLTPSLGLFVEPYFRLGINKNNISAGFTQQFNTVGANIGIRYRLNNKN